jgi:hypothetical protein
MKVVCIDNSKYPQLEVGKVYEADLLFYENKNKPFEWERKIVKFYQDVLILEEFDKDDWFGTKYFIKIEDWREINLNKLFV